MNRLNRIRSIHTIMRRAEPPATVSYDDELAGIAREPCRIVRPPLDANPTRSAGAPHRAPKWRTCPRS